MKKSTEINKELNGIFAIAGYTSGYTRHNRWFKALAEITESGLIKFRICDKGLVWRDGDKKWNVLVAGVGKTLRSYLKTTSITPYDVLSAMARFLQDESVKPLIKSHVNTDLTCDRCQGMGYIRQFHYYCDGICFECYGSGYSRHKHLKVEIVN